jgi:hypothetical protein
MCRLRPTIEARSISHLRGLLVCSTRGGCFLSLRLGMTGLVPRPRSFSQFSTVASLLAQHALRRLHSADEALRAPVICSLNATHICWQTRFNPRPLSSLSQGRFLLMNPSPNTNQYRIVEAEGLMMF